jgi:hypothetical protein
MHEFASYQNMSYNSHLQEKTEVKREIFVFVKIGGGYFGLSLWRTPEPRGIILSNVISSTGCLSGFLRSQE